MNWSYIFIAIFIYFVIVGCLCSSIRVIPYNRSDLAYSTVTENFEERTAENNYVTPLGNMPEEVMCKKVHGFKDLQCCPHSSSQTVDRFRFTEGKKGCNGLGLFNSTGSLCLNDTQVKLLKTRGGNMQLPDSQIGP